MTRATPRDWLIGFAIAATAITLLLLPCATGWSPV